MARRRKKRNRKDQSRTGWLIAISVAGLAVAAGVLYAVLGGNSVNHVQDESLGISFDIDERFAPIAPGELAQENPSFMYGYRPGRDPSSGCYISQTLRSTGGEVSDRYLENGTLDAIKQNFPDAKLLGSEPVEVKEDYRGVLMDISFQEEQQTIIRTELVVPTETRTVFAFCDTPQATSAEYQSDFDGFFSSLRLQPDL